MSDKIKTPKNNNMENPIANLFLSLQNTIAALADGSGNKYFKYVDQDLGQLNRQEIRPPVLFPCALIDVDEFSFISETGKVQSGRGTVKLRVGFPPLSSTGSATPVTYQQQALYYYELEQLLYVTLQDRSPILFDNSVNDILKNIFGNYNRVSATTLKNTATLRVRELVFTIAFDDYSAQQASTIHPAAFQITEEIQLPG